MYEDYGSKTNAAQAQYGREVHEGVRQHARIMGGIWTDQSTAGMAKEVSPQSAVQARLGRKGELLSELEQSVQNLIAPLQSILAGDPRKQKAERVEACSQPGNPSSCELEAVLMGENERISSVIDLLRDIRNAIRL